MKVVEVILPLFSNIYADLYNVEYLSRCNKKIKVVYTNYGDVPHFVNNKVDMIYMGSMPDSKIIPAIEFLKPYKDTLKQMIEDEVVFLLTGNSLEIFSSYITENGKKTEGLNLFDYYIEKNLNARNTSWYLGSFGRMKVIGHRNQCSKCLNNDRRLLKTIGGLGSDLIEKSDEGIKYKNFHATYLLGPIFILNPKFTMYILELLKLDTKLIHEKEITQAYKKRLEYFQKPDARFVMGDHG